MPRIVFLLLIRSNDHRLKVPAIRSVLEYSKCVFINRQLSESLREFYSSFLILFILFVVAIEMNERDKLNTAEVLFMVYALGFTLEKIAAMQEHGIKGNQLSSRIIEDRNWFTFVLSILQRHLG